jgi:hypothetical protein
MFLSNSPLLDELLTKRPGNTATSLLELDSPGERVENAFLSVLGRDPDKEERRRTAEFLAGRTAEAGVEQLLWALLTSTEFLVNH